MFHSRTNLTRCARLRGLLRVAWPTFALLCFAPPAGAQEAKQVAPTVDWMLLGPVAEKAEESASPARLEAIFGSVETPIVDPERLVWRDGEPFAWIAARANLLGELNIGRAFSPAKRGNAVYLYRRIDSPNATTATLALAANGAFAAWLNGQPLAMEQRGSKPAALRAGTNHLIVRALAPSDGAPWVLRALPLDSQSDSTLPEGSLLSPAERPTSKTPLPEGWRRLSAKSAKKDGKAVPYLFYVPKRIWQEPLPEPETIPEPEPEPEPKVAPTPTADSPTTDSLDVGNPDANTTVPVRKARALKEVRNARRARIFESPPSNAPAAKAPEASEAPVKAEATPPPDKSSKSKRPVALVVAPTGTDPWHVLLREPSLLAEADRMGWALAVGDLPKADGALRIEAIDAVRLAAIEQTDIDPRHVALVALGSDAETVLARALEMPGVYSAVATVDAEWSGIASWQDLVLGCVPRPALFFASEAGRGAPEPLKGLEDDLEKQDGPWLVRETQPGERQALWREMFEFLARRRLAEGSQRVALAGYVSSRLSLDWLTASKAIDSARQVYVSVDCESSRTLNITSENVESFELRLSEIPDLADGGPVALNIDYGEREGVQRLQIIYPQMPKRISLQLVERPDKSHRWLASEAESKPPDSRPVARLATAASAQPACARALARAARLASGAAVALVPTGAALGDMPADSVGVDDLVARMLDSKLTTTSLPTRLLIEAVERDYARARFLTTDGLDAIVRDPAAGPAGGVDEPGSADGSKAAQEKPTSPTQSVADAKPAMPDATEPYRLAAPEERNSPITLSAFSPDAGEVVVVGWSGLIDNLLARIGNGPDAPTPHYLQSGQREAFIGYLAASQGPIDLNEAADVRSLQGKKAVQMKWLKP